MFLFALGAVVSALAKQVRGQSGFLKAVELDPHQVARAIAFARRELEEDIEFTLREPAEIIPPWPGSHDFWKQEHAGAVRRQLEELKSFEEGWITGTPETLEQLQKISALAKQGQPEAAGQMLLALIPLWGSSGGYSSFEGGRLWDFFSTPGSSPGYAADYIARDDEAVELAGLSDEYTDEHAASDALRYVVVAGGHPAIVHQYRSLHHLQDTFLSPERIYMAVAATLTAGVLWDASTSRPLRGFGYEDRLRLFHDWVEEARSSATSPSGSIG